MASHEELEALKQTILKLLKQNRYTRALYYITLIAPIPSYRNHLSYSNNITTWHWLKDYLSTNQIKILWENLVKLSRKPFQTQEKKQEFNELITVFLNDVDLLEHLTKENIFKIAFNLNFYTSVLMAILHKFLLDKKEHYDLGYSIEELTIGGSQKNNVLPNLFLKLPELPWDDILKLGSFSTEHAGNLLFDLRKHPQWANLGSDLAIYHQDKKFIEEVVKLWQMKIDLVNDQNVHHSIMDAYNKLKKAKPDVPELITGRQISYWHEFFMQQASIWPLSERLWQHKEDIAYSSAGAVSIAGIALTKTTTLGFFNYYTFCKGVTTGVAQCMAPKATRLLLPPMLSVPLFTLSALTTVYSLYKLGRKHIPQLLSSKPSY